MFRSCCEIDDVVGIAHGIVELFDIRLGQEESAGGLIGIAGAVMCFPCPGSRHVPQVGEPLSHGHERHVIPDIEETLAADRANFVVPLVHTTAEREVGFAFRLRVRSEKDSSLHIIRHLRPGDAQPCLRHVHETDQAIHSHPRFFRWPEVAEFLRYAYDQRGMSAAVGKKPLAARHHATVIGSENHDGVFRQAFSIQTGKQFTHARVHAFDSVGIVGIVVSNAGNVGVVCA